MIDVQRYRVQLHAGIGGLSADELGAWALGILDALLDDPTVLEADVGATLATGLVEFDLQLDADTTHDAMRTAEEAIGRAAAAPTRDGARPAFDHAEVDRVAVPA